VRRSHRETTDLSVQNRLIYLHVFGSGRRTVMVMAGVHGDEPCGVEVVRNLTERLEGMGEGGLGDLRVVVMPLANPDGHALGTRKNANGIDINRNFATKDFGAGENDASNKFYGGHTPASEPETHAIMGVISAYEPGLIISLHEPLACVNYNGPSVRIARRISKLTGLPAKGDIGYPCPGSMGTYYGLERRLPLITLELPEDEIDPEHWAGILLLALRLPVPG
jgi:protein MpaA